MNDNNPIQPSEEKALRAMQHSCLTDRKMPEDWAADEECMKLCTDIARTAIGMNQEENPFHINAAEELTRFHQKHRRKKRRLWPVAVTVAAAALLAAVFFLAEPSEKNGEGVVIYQADAVRQSVTIQTTGMDEPQPLDEFVAKQADAGLTYRADSLYCPQSKGHNREKDGEKLSAQATYVLNVPKGETFNVVLSDGSEVLLNANSRLTYPKTFRGNHRVVALEGEAYFSVARRPEKPFIVKCGAMQVQVLGTEFNVKNHASEHSEVTLVEGKVALNTAEGKHLINMVPGQKATLLEGDKLVTEMTDTEYLTYWKQGYFYFDDVTLAEMMKKIGEWYHVDVIFESSKIVDLRIHFFADRHQDIRDIIERLNNMESIYAYLEGGRLFVR